MRRQHPGPPRRQGPRSAGPLVPSRQRWAGKSRVAAGRGGSRQARRGAAAGCSRARPLGPWPPLLLPCKGEMGPCASLRPAQEPQRCTRGELLPIPSLRGKHMPLHWIGLPALGVGPAMPGLMRRRLQPEAPVGVCAHGFEPWLGCAGALAGGQRGADQCLGGGCGSRGWSESVALCRSLRGHRGGPFWGLPQRQSLAGGGQLVLLLPHVSPAHSRGHRARASRGARGGGTGGMGPWREVRCHLGCPVRCRLGCPLRRRCSRCCRR